MPRRPYDLLDDGRRRGKIVLFPQFLRDRVGRRHGECREPLVGLVQQYAPFGPEYRAP